MKTNAGGMGAPEIKALVNYIAASRKIESSHIPGCAATGSAGNGIWNGWSRDASNTRFQPNPGLTAADVPRLKLRWALVFPSVPTAANPITILNGHLYTGSWDGTIYSLDAASGCSHWTYQAEAAVRTGITIADSLAIFGDLHGTAYAVDSGTGELRWKLRVEDHPWARITGSPVVYDKRVYVPVASLEEGAAGNPKYPCCTFRGSVVALDLATGKQLWKSYTIDQPPAKTGVTQAGTEQFGPSGAAVWSPPTIDEKRGLVYIGTGNNYTTPDTPGADAIIAFDLKTGARRWVRQVQAADVWNVTCVVPDKSNCRDKEGPDYDFGSPPMLVHTNNGRDMLVAGQKSGIVYGLDPDKDGALLWKTVVGPGGTVGGVEWGMASDGDKAYVSVAGWEWKNPRAEGSVSALDLSTGKLLWQTPNPAEACKDRRSGCTTAIAAPATATPGVIFAGSVDGHLRAYEASSGKVLWEYDAETDINGINGLKGHGGSINGAGTTVANGLVYQTAGYEAFALGMGGNVLLVFEAEP
jgi:polyvinyl alcohol dehydrogenase (cytochrome)